MDSAVFRSDVRSYEGENGVPVQGLSRPGAAAGAGAHLRLRPRGWNRTLAARRALYAAEGTRTSYAQTDRALTQMKKDPELAFLNEVSSVPLQQALRHQHQAFAAFFGKRARYPRFKSRRGRQSAHYTRSAVTVRDGRLRLAKTDAPLRFTWSWPDIDMGALDPAMVIVSREPDGRWYVTFAVDAADAQPLPPAGHAAGVDLGVKDFAVTSDGEKIANPRHLARRTRNLARYQRRLARCRNGSANRAKAAAKVARAHRKVRNARTDFLHRASTRLVRENDMVVIEDLHVSGMIKTARWPGRSQTAAGASSVASSRTNANGTAASWS